MTSPARVARTVGAVHAKRGASKSTQRAEPHGEVIGQTFLIRCWSPRRGRCRNQHLGSEILQGFRLFAPLPHRCRCCTTPPKPNVSALSKSRPRPQGLAPQQRYSDSISTGHTLRTQNLSRQAVNARSRSIADAAITDTANQWPLTAMPLRHSFIAAGAGTAAAAAAWRPKRPHQLGWLTGGQPPNTPDLEI